MTVDRDRLANAVAHVNQAMKPCAGGIEVRDVDDQGVIQIGFIGMCTGCTCRSVTTVAHIRPALESLPDVKEVHVENSRMSRYAEERAAKAFGLQCRATEDPS